MARAAHGWTQTLEFVPAWTTRQSPSRLLVHDQLIAPVEEPKLRNSGGIKRDFIDSPEVRFGEMWSLFNAARRVISANPVYG
jgi:hypothetical protein